MIHRATVYEVVQLYAKGRHGLCNIIIKLYNVQINK